ncbi:MFS transporter [Micromonospora sp. NPDC023633]|uniref:MFS transporter n=1 Tax=Micromonospora sp. NPDC023633 TaxID=3154320 RepID=UPI0034070DF1
MLDVLRHRAYRRLFTAQVIALLGTGLATVALALLAYRLAGPSAGAVLGTALGIKMTANVIVAPVASALLARLPRRAVLVALDLVRAGVAVLLPWVDQIWQIYLLVFVLQAAAAAFTPAFQATITDLLPDEDDYTHALSLSRLAYDLEMLLSPALAAAALTLLSFDDLFLGTAAGFTASALLVTCTLIPHPRPAHHGGSLYRRTTLGVRRYLGVPRLRGLLALHLAVAAAGAMVLVNTVIAVRHDLGRDESDVAVALGAYGTGSLLVALALPTLLRHHADRLLMLVGSATGAVILLATTTVSAGAGAWRWPALLTAWALLGGAGSLVLTPSGRLLRRSADDGHRPAMFAADYALSHACWLLTYPLAGWLAATAGTTWALVALSALAATATALAAHSWPTHDPDELEHEHRGLDGGHEHLRDAQPVGAGGSWRHTHRYHLDDHHPTWPG